jgi:PAS domain S-box-containing protein
MSKTLAEGLPWVLLSLTFAGMVVFFFLYLRQRRALNQFNRKNLFTNLKKLDLLYTLIDSMPDWIYVKDRESRFILANRHLAESMGAEDPETLNGTTDFDYYPKEMASSFYEDEQGLLKSGQSLVNKVETVITSQGRKVILSTTKIPVKNQAGEVVGLVGIGRDITPQKEAEERMAALSTVASATDNTVVIMDRNGDFQWVNRKFEEKYEKTLDEFVNDHGRNLRENSSNENIGEILDRVVETRESQTYLTRIRDKDGNDVWYQTSISPVIDNSGDISSIFLIDLDITQIKKADLQIKQQRYELESQRDELKKLNASKDRLFSIIAHDLKNPFQSIIGFSELLIRDHKNLNNDQLEEYLECIHSASSSAYDLLYNLLEWARVQAGGITPNPVPVQLNLLVNEISDLHCAQAKDKQITIINQVNKEAVVLTDQNMLHTVLRNLTSNAIKFTPSGGKVTYSSSLGEGVVEIGISDSGVGIPEGKIRNLFTLEQSKSTRGTSGEPGTGLGLVVCKEFLQLNKGSIRVESAPGKGSTFTITFPTE